MTRAIAARAGMCGVRNERDSVVSFSDHPLGTSGSEAQRIFGADAEPHGRYFPRVIGRAAQIVVGPKH